MQVITLILKEESDEGEAPHNKAFTLIEPGPVVLVSTNDGKKQKSKLVQIKRSVIVVIRFFVDQIVYCVNVSVGNKTAPTV